jgi:hypothetical protein
VSAVDEPTGVQDLEILADGDPGGIELLGQLTHQDAPVPIYRFQNGATAFFVQHDEWVNIRAYVSYFFL